MFAFDIGAAVDLDLATTRLAHASRAGLAGVSSTRSRDPVFEFEPLPLRVVEPAQTLAPLVGEAAGPVEVTIYDFGAVSVLYRIAVEGTLESLRGRMPALLEAAELRDDARRRVERMVEDRLGDAVDRPEVAEDEEDYLVLVLTPPDGGPGGLDRATLAGLLRGEPASLSEEEARDALVESLRYGVDDLVAVDWRAAVVFDREPEQAVEVLEFLNVQLLEFRHLDRKLDDALTAAYRTLRGPDGFAGRGLGWRFSAASRDWRRLARLQVDAALLYESIQNALKLVGDQYLARLMTATSRRFHLSRWESSILRKLEVLESIYAKFADSQAHRRSEILEWIIIALIAFEVFFGFLPTLWR